MTFNIRSCHGGVEDVAATIRKARPDLVALQEVDRGTDRGGGGDQVERLAALTGLQHTTFVRTTSLHGGDYGIALLSRYPIERVDHWSLVVRPGMEPRAVARAILDVDGREVSVWKTHLTSMPMNSSIRAEQAAQILRLMRDDPRPRMLLGDMNDIASSEPVRLFSRHLTDAFATAGKGPSGTYPLPLGATFRYDYVLTSSEIVVDRAFVLRSDVSDHYPVVADIELPAVSVAEAPTAEANPQTH